MIELNNKTKIRKNTDTLQSRIDELTEELSKTQLVLWEEVDKRRKAEHTLVELEEMHYRILEAANYGILILDQNGKILKANSCMEKITGYSIEELRVKGFIALSPNAAHRRELQRIISSMDQIQDWQILLKCKDDTTRTVVLNIKRTVLNGQTILISRVQDITEWKSFEEKLRESMAYKDQILNHIADPIFIKNRRHMFVLANDAFCSLAGKKRENIIGTSGYRYMSREQASSLFEQDEAIFKTGKACVTEDTVIDGDGHTHTLITKKTLLVKKTGEKQIVGVIRDVTEQKQLEAQFLQAQKMEAVGVLAGGVAHDFNNLLNVINGYSELALENPSIEDSVRKDIGNVLEAGNRAATLTSQLLAFSRKRLPQPDILSLNDILSGMSSMLRRLIGENIEYTANLEPDIGLIHADVGQIHQVVMNLAINARDAMPHGGTLTIETANIDFYHNDLRNQQEVKPGAYVMLAMSDNGVGMDQRIRSHLFEPFFTTKDKEKGTGLGLSTVQGIVKHSDGFIRVYSEPGKGTAFKLFFPRAGAELLNDIKEDSSKVQLRGNETVLVVEDEEGVRSLISRILKERGYTVLEAFNGMDALKLARQCDKSIQLVITDVVMPELGGKELMSRLEKEREGIKVLYISGYTDSGVVRQGMLDPEDPFLQKPFTADSLINKVQTAICKN